MEKYALRTKQFPHIFETWMHIIPEEPIITFMAWAINQMYNGIRKMLSLLKLNQWNKYEMFPF